MTTQLAGLLLFSTQKLKGISKMKLKLMRLIPHHKYICPSLNSAVLMCFLNLL
jgi:hypothetical protein